MTKSAPQRTAGATLKVRQREVEQRLALFGLKPGPRRLVVNGVSAEEDQICRLRQALESLGPVFISFGLYMSTRIDLLGADDCLELAKLPNRARQSSPAAIQNLIKTELGQQPDELFSNFEEIPVVSGPLLQEHRAWLRDGEAVSVRLLRPEVREFLQYDTQVLPRLAGAFIGKDCSKFQIESAIEDSILWLQPQTNLALYSRALATLSRDTELFGMLRVPFVYEEFSTSKIITIERLPGHTVHEMLKSMPEAGVETTVIEDEERYGLARRLCIAWLRQALLGSTFPVEPCPENITILPNNQIAFTDGGLASLPTDAKASIWDYLVALVTENPDRACTALLKELVREKRSVSADELRQRFRQLVPFRDGEWVCDGDQNNLAETLFLHWKVASRSGYLPRVHLPSFYRGLFTIATVARRLAPRRDALRDAVQHVRLLAGMERFREMLSVEELNEQVNRYLGIMMNLPQSLDETLTLMAEGSARLKMEAGKEDGKGQTNSPTLLVALFISLLSCALLSHYFAASGGTGPWADRLSAIAFVALGAMVLRVATR